MDPKRSRRIVALTMALAALAGAAACSGDDGGSDGSDGDGGSTAATAAVTTSPAATTPGTTAAAGLAPDDARPVSTPTEAVETFLQAEIDGDHAASFALLSTEGRAEHPDLADWVARRAELPVMIGFTIESTAGPTVVARVDNEPGLDAFKGLSAAHERQTWRARQTTDGWLLDAEPGVELLLPSDAGAVSAAKAWAQAVQACDEAAGRSLQAVEPLYGVSQQAGVLCGSTGAVEVGALVALPPGPASTDLVAQYSADVDQWARAVPVTAPVRFTVVLAPLGDVWRVIAVSD